MQQVPGLWCMDLPAELLSREFLAKFLEKGQNMGILGFFLTQGCEAGDLGTITCLSERKVSKKHMEPSGLVTLLGKWRLWVGIGVEHPRMCSCDFVQWDAV